MQRANDIILSFQEDIAELYKPKLRNEKAHTVRLKRTKCCVVYYTVISTHPNEYKISCSVANNEKLFNIFEPIKQSIEERTPADY